MSKTIDLGPLNTWEAVGTARAETRADSGAAELHAEGVRYEYLLAGPRRVLLPGVYRVCCEASVTRGEVAVGVLDSLGRRWAGNVALTATGESTLTIAVLRPSIYRVVLSGHNHAAPVPVEATVIRVSLLKIGGVASALMATTRAAAREATRFSRAYLKPFLYVATLRIQRASTIAWRGLRPAAEMYGFPARFCVVDFGSLGYAVRSLALLRRRDGMSYIVSADFGDDTLSFLEFFHGRLGARRVVRLPKLSAPLPVCALPRENADDILCLGLFNLDESGAQRRVTSLLMSEEPKALVSAGWVPDPEKSMTVLASRAGHWGYRGLSVIPGKGGGIYHLAAVDRDAGRLQTFCVDVRDKPTVRAASELELPQKLEPIGIGMLLGQDGAITYFLNSRHFENLYTIRQDRDGALAIKDTVPLGGRSRSSVAVARLGKGRRSIVVALWGGAPLEINDAVRGKVVVADLDDENGVCGCREFLAGVHPTDVACGDFDGDGVDEIAVLNYGTGLGPADRSHPGGLEFFKECEDGFRCIGRVCLPNPRIAKVIDIDNDGRDELLVSLFFERMVVLVKLI